MPVEKITLTASFKVDLTDVDEATISEIYRLFDEYREIVNELIEYAHLHKIINHIRLCHAKYHELRQKHPTLPSHYIVTACHHAASINLSFIKLKKLGIHKKNRKKIPTFRKRMILLDDHLFRLDTENWKASIALYNRRRITLKLLHGRHHDKFKGMKPGESCLVLKRDGNLYLDAAFTQTIMLPEISADAKIIAIDINENTITYGNNDFTEKLETNEGIIRTRYFLKYRKIQSKIRSKQLRRKLFEKYRGREQHRIREIYYKAAKKIINKAKETGATIIIMEDIKHLNRKNKGSKELNGRLRRWSYRKFQQILEYQAKLHGLNVKYINPAYTSIQCPACGNKLTPSKHRIRKCTKCGLEEDRDVIAVKNLVKRYHEEYMNTKTKPPSPDKCGEPAFPPKASQ